MFAKIDLTQLTAILAAAITASVALIAFAFNYRATLRQQRDTQFYEALKRLGDTSPAVRSSAAGLLAQLGKHKKLTLWRWKWRASRVRWLGIPCPVIWHFPYFETALDQLATSLQLESDPVVLDSIQDASEELASADSESVLRRIVRANMTLQEHLALALAEFASICTDADTHENICEDDWQQAACVTGYDAAVLQGLARDDRFVNGFASRFTVCRGMLSQEQEASKSKECGLEAFNNLSWAAGRLRKSASVIAHVSRTYRSERRALSCVFLVGEDLRSANLQEADLGAAELQGADLGVANLQGANLIEANLHRAELCRANLHGAELYRANLHRAELGWANLHGADLHRANLHGATLFKSKIDNQTNLAGAHWWQADFYEEVEGSKIDTALLEELFSRNSNNIPEDLTQCHPSVHKFIEEKRREKAQEH